MSVKSGVQLVTPMLGKWRWCPWSKLGNVQSRPTEHTAQPSPGLCTPCFMMVTLCCTHTAQPTAVPQGPLSSVDADFAHTYLVMG